MNVVHDTDVQNVARTFSRLAVSLAQRHGAWLVFLAVMAIQTIVWLDYRRSPFYAGLICDAKQYAEWAQALLASHGVSREVFYQPPLYPYLLSALWAACGPSLTIAYLAQLVLNAGAAALVFLMGCACGGRKAGWIAALLYGLYGMLTFYALKLLSETLAVFLHVLLAFLIMGLHSRRRLAVAGVVCGLLILAKPQAMLLVPPILLYVLLRSGTARFRARLYFAACFGLPALLFVGVTAWHNYSIERRLVWVAANGGINFYIGNHAKADGIYTHVDAIAPGIERQDQTFRAAAERETGRRLTKADMSAFWFHKGLAYIRGNWQRFLRLEWIKLKRMLSAVEYSNMYYLTFEQKTLTKSLRWLAINFALLWPLAAAGVAVLIAQRRGRRFVVLWIMLVIQALNMLIFFVDERFRLSMLPFLIVLAAAGLVCGVETILNRALPLGRRLGTAALILLAGGAAVASQRLDTGRPSVDHILHIFLGDIYFERSDYTRALNEYYTSSRLAANNWESAMEISKVMYAVGRKDLALTLYRQALPNLNPIMAADYLINTNFAGLRALAGTNEEPSKPVSSAPE